VQEGAASPATPDTAITPERRRAVWPTVKQPPQKSTSTGLSTPEELWPRILEAVKERRRFSWILLSQNAKVTRFDGKRLRLAFSNDAAREHYLSAEANEALEQVLHEIFEASWKIDIVAEQ
jgi:DNA polymerase-3 subunit gamma/tau